MCKSFKCPIMRSIIIDAHLMVGGEVRIVVSRVRLFTGDNRPSEDEELYKMGFRKRLSAPLISSLIHAFMHPSSSSTSSKKSSLQFTNMEDTTGSSFEENRSSAGTKRKSNSY
ncbi:unnamed protein product [Rodentolepis nana]|uniref:Uncharacterized protein n=1 Tax=Rodentolepis nana TaxID=102285 RepID=A0A0R3TGN2_RODNA|nr:unnamed protein product [Rodentolepis nana]